VSEIPKYLKLGAGIFFVASLAVTGIRKSSESQPNDIFAVGCRLSQNNYDICIGSDGHFINLTRTPNFRDHFNSWSPDGKSFVYSKTNSTTSQNELHIRDIQKGTDKPIIDKGFGYSPQWIKDGPYKEKILFLGSGFGKDKIWPYIVDPKDPQLNIKPVDLGEEFDDIESILLSPNGKTMAILTFDNTYKRNTFWTKSLSNKEDKPTQVMFLPKDDSVSSPIFSPDSKKIAFVHYAQGGKVGQFLLVKDLEKGNLKWLGVKAFDFDWAPDSEKIAFAYTYGIYIVDVNSKERKQLTVNGLNTDMQVNWGKDERIYYENSTNSELFLRSMKPDGSDNQQLFVVDPDTSNGFGPEKVIFQK